MDAICARQMSPTSRIRSRQILCSDLDNIASLFAKGFPAQPERSFWASILQRLSKHSTPPGFPQYGYVLDKDGAIVGAILLIFSRVLTEGKAGIRCSVSSWYVEPPFRMYASLLISHALRNTGATYSNVTPAAHTLPMLEAQGYERYCSGQWFCLPALCLRSLGCRITSATPNLHPDDDLPSSEVELLLDHASYGCMSLVCTSRGRRYPFVFTARRTASRRVARALPFVHLLYCRGLEDFARFAGPLGRFLLGHGIPLVTVDSDGPIRGVPGTYRASWPKYFKGPDRPRFGDLAYSEIAMFGV